MWLRSKRYKVSIMLGATVSLFNISSCKSAGASRAKAMKEAIDLGASRFNDPDELKKTPVIIFYANESSFTAIKPEGGLEIRDNWDHLFRVLATCGSPDGTENPFANLMDKIQNDQAKFIQTVDWESSALKSISQKAPGKFKLIEFRNINLRKPGNATFTVDGTVTAWPEFPPSSEYAEAEVYKFQPLMHPMVFAQAMDKVRKIAPPETHRYILIAKSHGNISMAMTALLAKDIRGLKREEICKAVETYEHVKVESTGNSGTGAIGKNEESPMGKNEESPMGKNEESPMGKDPNGGLGYGSALDYISTIARPKSGLDAPSSGSDLPGITKDKFSDILLGHSDMYFPVVVMESCNSQYAWKDKLRSTTASKSSANISYVYTSDHGGLNYRNIDYQSLFKSISTGQDVQRAFKEILDMTSRETAKK